MATVTTITDVRGYDPGIEQWLDSWHVAYTLREHVRPEEFDYERSLSNQARLGDPVDAETVERYTEAMKSGAEFPAVVAHPGPNGLVIIDGNHRLVSARDASYTLPVYEVTDARAVTLTTLTFEANVRHGKATSEEERVHHALYLIDNGMAKPEAARRMNIKVSRIDKHSRNLDAQRRADDAGVSRKDWDLMPEALRNRIAQITTDEAMVAVVDLVKEAGLQTMEVFDVVAQVNDTRSAKKQLEVVAALRIAMGDRIQDKLNGEAPGKGKRVRSPKSALATSLGLMITMPSTDVIVGSLSPSEKEYYAKRLDDAVERLVDLRKTLVS